MKVYQHGAYFKQSAITLTYDYVRHATDNDAAEYSTARLGLSEIGPVFYNEDRGTGHRRELSWRDELNEFLATVDTTQYPLGPIGRRGGHTGYLIVYVKFHVAPWGGRNLCLKVTGPDSVEILHTWQGEVERGCA